MNFLSMIWCWWMLHNPLIRIAGEELVRSDENIYPTPSLSSGCDTRSFFLKRFDCSVGCSCRIHQLLLCRRVRPPPYECPEFDTKQSDGEVPAMQEFWEIRSTPSLPSLPNSLWPGVVAPGRVLSMGQIELNCVLMLNWIA